jgi:hypothetical protein
MQPSVYRGVGASRADHWHHGLVSLETRSGATTKGGPR